MKQILTLTKAINDTNRLRALMALGEGQWCLCQLIELLGLAPSTVSRHMAVLQQAGLVSTRKDGRWTWYRLTESPQTPGAGEILAVLRRCLGNDEQIVRDAHRLKTIRKIDREKLCTHYHKEHHA